MQTQRLNDLKSLLLPVLWAAYPVVFLYSHNAAISQPSSMALPVLVVAILAVALFGLFLVFQRRAVYAGLSTLAFFVFFHSYGALYTRLVNYERFQVEHYTLLPLVVVCAFYLAFFVTKLKPETAVNIRNILLLLAAGLVVWNILQALPAEIEKARTRAAGQIILPAAVAAENSPDIYYLVFDEYAGFKALREYWGDREIDAFAGFLREKDFFVAENSRSETTDTLHEMASRLNLVRYPVDLEDYNLFFEAIANNRVMQILKSRGYTTVVFDGASVLYSTKKPINADYNFVYDESRADTSGISPDEFAVLFFDQTMARAFSYLYALNNATNDLNQNMILYSLEKVLDLDEIPGPKFVYLHVMLPHMPVMFDEKGGPVDLKHREDWNYYPGQHKYATQRARQIIDQILRDADPQRPPIIILQSDHGARNHEPSSPDGVVLENYDDAYMTMIMNALYLPGYDYSRLSDDLAPVETFVIVLNHYFDAGVAVETYTPGD
jgi:hypothetical protein